MLRLFPDVLGLKGLKKILIYHKNDIFSTETGGRYK
jgi:hypothetical protein